jgi:hypothetical protein
MTHEKAVQTGASERYLLEEMSELERHAFEDHYFSCLECAEDVRTGGMLREGVRAGLLRAETAPGRATVTQLKPASMKFVWTPSAVIPWAVAATLALAVGYQSLTPPVQPLQPQALAPVTLRAASRGAEATVPLAPGAGAVTLAIDINGAEPGDLAYELRTAESSVASGTVQAPAPGAPLLLLVPVWTLRAGEHYILTVRHAPTGNPVGEFRFGVTQ